MPPWLCATQISSVMGSTRWRASDWRIRILPTTGPLPCVMISSVSSSIRGSSALPSPAATSACSLGVPRIPSGCVAFPPIAMTRRLGISSLMGIAESLDHPAAKAKSRRSIRALQIFSKFLAFDSITAFFDLLAEIWSIPYGATPPPTLGIRGAGELTLEKIELANKETVRRILQGEPVLVDVQPAGEVIKGLAKHMILHAGPPITWDRMCGPMRGAICGIAVFEGWAKDLAEAE